MTVEQSIESEIPSVNPITTTATTTVQQKDLKQDPAIREQTPSTSDDHPTDIIPDRIFVGNLPYEVTEEQVRNLTPEYDVVSVEIPRKNYYNQHLNRYILQSKGYGFITYVNADDAKQAIDSIVGKFISGREIYAKYALPQNKAKFQKDPNLNYNNNQQPQNHNLQPHPIHHNMNNNHFRHPYAPPNFIPTFIPIPMNQQRGNNGGNSSGSAGSYYYEIPAAPVLNLPPMKFDDPTKIEPFFPQKIEMPQQMQQKLSKEERRKKLENGKPSKLSVFIGNLERNVTHYDMEQYLKSKGLPIPVHIKIPKKNLQPEVYQVLKMNKVKIQNKGIGFVKFATHQDQIKTIEVCNGDVWNGKKLNVTVAINVEDEEETGEPGGEEEEAEKGEEVVAKDEDDDNNDENNNDDDDDDDDEIEVEVVVSDSDKK